MYKVSPRIRFLYVVSSLVLLVLFLISFTPPFPSALQVDLAGIAREGWEREVTAAFVSHLEEMLQHGRAASLAQGRMVSH